MTFQISLIDHIKAVLVTQIIEVLVCRIVRTAHCIDIMLLHQKQIFLHFLVADSPSFFRVIVVMIGTV